MNAYTGAMYPSLKEAILSGERIEDLVSGPEPVIRRLSKLVITSNKAHERRKARRGMAKASRKRNR